MGDERIRKPDEEILPPRGEAPIASEDEAPEDADDELADAGTDESGDEPADASEGDHELDEPVADEPEPSTPDGSGADPRWDRRRRRLEKLVPDLLKRAIERGIEAGLHSIGNAGRAKPEREGTIPPPPGAPSKEPQKDAAPKDPAHREIASVPKEIAGYVFSQIDDTKNAMVRVVAREVREFLEAADLATELQKALTMLSFEIRTEIRFIPNDAGGIKPEVKAAIAPKKKKAERRPAGRRPTAMAAEDDDGDDPL